jgi:hypothetical protein
MNREHGLHAIKGERTMRILPVSLFGSLVLASLTAGAQAVGNDIRVDASKLGAPERIYVYEGGRIAVERAIQPGSDEARAIMAWLGSHQDGWRSSLRTGLTTYAPQNYVRGKRFTLNFTSNGRFCVLNYETGSSGRWRQLTRHIAKNDPIPKVFHSAP